MSERDLTTPEDDELLRPALTGVRQELPASGRRPWRLTSQLYVGFFGGVIAATVISWLNARRLGLPLRPRLLIAGIGGAALLIAAIVVVAAGFGTFREIRFVLHVSGIAAAGLQRLPQANADRRYGVQQGEEGYDSLWVPGIVAVLVLGTLQNVLLYGLTEI